MNSTLLQADAMLAVSTSAAERNDEQRMIGRAAALLFAISLLIGWLLGLILINKIHADERIIRGAHLSALMGPLFLAAYGWSLPLLRFSNSGRRWLTRGIILTFYANPLLNVVRGLLGVPAVQINGQLINDGLFIIMTLFSGLPAMVSSAAWIIGVWKPATKR